MGRLSPLALAVFAAVAEARLGTGGAAMAMEASRGPETVKAMASLGGEACSEDEKERYHEIVCRTEEACGCADTRCELDWCSEYVHKWKKEFGACTLEPCPTGQVR